jgi:hypothetical protein
MNTKGQSLISVIIAMGMASILMVSMMKFSKDVVKINKSTRTMFDVNQTQYLIKNHLEDHIACTNTFSGQKATNNDVYPKSGTVAKRVLLIILDASGIHLESSC